MEATRETMQRCLVLALTPVLTQMSVMGVVSIPGMMTGQILGGTVPSQVPHPQRISAKDVQTVMSLSLPTRFILDTDRWCVILGAGSILLLPA